MIMARNSGNKKKGKQSRFSFFSDMTQEKKSAIYRYCGLAVLALTLFTLASLVSYLFTWQEDQSLLAHPDMIDKSVDVANWGGKAGYRWSEFLVARCFGLGSFALVFLMGAVAFRLYFWNRSIGLFRTFCITIAGTFLVSLILAFISYICGVGHLFGGSMGGDAGYAVVTSLSNLVGDFATALVLIVLSVAWLLVSNKRFAHWFAVDKVKETSVEDDQPAQEEFSSEHPQPEEEVSEDIVPDDVDPAEPCEQELPQVPETQPEPEPEPQRANVDTGIEIIRGQDIVTEVTEDLPPFDNRLDLERFEAPSLDLLKDYADGQHRVSQQELDINNNRIRATLLNYKIDVVKVMAVVGPTVTLYKVFPAPGVRVASIETVHREIAMALGVDGVRVVMLPDSVGIEVPNARPSIVPLKSVLNSDAFRNSTAELPIAIGCTITKEIKTFDLTDAPHLLVAGATKQGKSVGLNVIISSLLYSKHPSELKFVFVDPKMVEFTAYNALLKHYLAVLPMAANEEEEKKNAIIKSSKQAEQVLSSLCIEMDERYNLLASAGVNDFKLYNEKYKNRHLLPTEGHKFLPYLVVVIDEYADLIMSGGANPDAKKAAKNIEASIIRLAQKGRAAGIHVIIATQRPSVNVITGLIKANFPTRIAFRVLSSTDSRTILDSNGAENLIGKGDMLYYAGVKMERVQCALVSMNEITKVTKFIGDQTGWKQCYGTPYYLPVPESQDGETSGGTIDMQNIDPMFEEAARMVVTSQRGSTSDLQRRLGMGYARAGRVMDQLEAAGIVGPQEGSKPRQVLVTNFAELDEILSHFVN
ncbi:MAG: DNA translocase FtsK [Bacteroidales bacterium]|nr:DNA translocase FtsK [Bacteroidales bacterium]